ncbi:hypothetical protein [Paractinoplanes globisporus]|jgi:hypothetical protein|uniref:Uncharacterized protein n=1 Tax=Paractinoplanes globisporus TaxID=113565 RepID=A0ABW6WAT3_9ACTN|nr:hypothetical protein [Actinoplanes globisporus]
MAVISREHALNVVRRVYGPEHAERVAPELPERIDLENPADTNLLYKLGLTPDGLYNALGSSL